MSKILGSNLSVGKFVSVKIARSNHADTVIAGAITGIQEWATDTIAIQISGLDCWIILRDHVEVQVV
ncbi:MAG: hypothetical protein EBR82_54810 [Caulobacteraceae bacterium]|nr:hypothetical protein [Caulobacteraceae bacterium]